MSTLNTLQQATTEHRKEVAIHGVLRADRRTKDLIKRIKPGEVALIHHADLDAMAARALVDGRVAAVLNSAPSISGRYPNGGPTVLIESGIPLIDGLGDEFFARAAALEGKQVAIAEDSILLPDGTSAHGNRLTAASVAELLDSARGNLGVELEHFARNTLEYLSEEKSILLDPIDVPELDTAMRGRHVMIVVRGEGYKDDLRAIGDYLHDVRPVLMGVDGGADALLEEGFTPDIIIGDMDSVSDAALKCGAELVVHGYASGARSAPGLARMEALGLRAKVFHAPGTSEDVAILLADERGASLIVAVGTHFSLVDFLDKGRGGMASTFLVRLRTGSKLVDAKGIGRLWEARLHSRNRPATSEMLLLILAALFPIGIIAIYSPWFRTVLSTIRLSLRSTFGAH